MMIVIFSVVGLIFGFIVAYFLGNKTIASKIKDAEQNAKNIVKDAEKEAANIKKEKLLEVKEEWHKRKQEFENEVQSRKAKIQTFEKQLKSREEAVEQKINLIQKKEKQLQNFESELQKRAEIIVQKKNELQAIIDKQTEKLEVIAGISREEAKKQIIDNLVEEAKTEAAAYIKQVRDEAKINAQREARNLLIEAIQRTASDHSIESTVSVVNLESDEMKGRIIGREGRNIRAFEAATGIDLIIDDTPEAVVISGFDPFRREVAKMSLIKLMEDGRIHPARIEEVVAKTKKELEDEIYRVGENAILELNLHNVHHELIKLIGKMKYRSSYGQNLLNHSIECAKLAGILAMELGLDAKIAKRAALMHDIGKCVDEGQEGPHALVGYELAKKYGEKPVVCNAIGAHHEDIEMESPYAVLVQVADSVSGARPGARRESLENYIKRLEKLETLANSFDGVQKTFAIQAGREVRVIVEPDKVNDIIADALANDIAKKIEQEMEYPGQIKVCVIRERRSISMAK
jgi:ribonuclease Y